ncbi:hypothetical protein CLV56_3995 [Mumia flava]|uniref:Uncharacterized protein n=1 Tax=Mumia flava TaxID=1348852 RepID=A0A0B2BNP4_9ACTN|nr:hypothetical protein [Mumia flava]PJJ48290.1 hypothetical protein CLV56_3995 [Mumia flava]
MSTIDPAALYRAVDDALGPDAGEVYDVGGVVATLLDKLDEPTSCSAPEEHVDRVVLVATTSIPADVFWLAVADNRLPDRTGPCPQELSWCTSHGFGDDPGDLGWHEHVISRDVAVTLDRTVSDEPRVAIGGRIGDEEYLTPSQAQALAEDLVRAAAYIAGIDD